jgi:hypothetical protein
MDCVQQLPLVLISVRKFLAGQCKLPLLRVVPAARQRVGSLATTAAWAYPVLQLAGQNISAFIFIIIQQLQ